MKRIILRNSEQQSFKNHTGITMPKMADVPVTLILLKILFLGLVLAQNTSEAVLPTAPHCGVSLSYHLLGGLRTHIDEFPWTALIEYRKPNGETTFRCGGSLINFRYVLTAAHCVNAIPSGWKVNGIRLGEWDLATDQDCEDEYCNDAPINMGIEKIITHADYGSNRSHYNDIALIRLNGTVERSNTISPVCLPVDEPQRSQNMEGKNVFVAGWGTIENGSPSNVKQHIPKKISDPERCADVYKRFGVVLKDTQMCATGFNYRDSCASTRGGSPLTKEDNSNQFRTLFNYQYGITSMGPRQCGSKDMPEVYTNVVKYIDWIQSNLE